MIKSAERDGNKKIADFNLQKSAAIFAKKTRGGHILTDKAGFAA
jgi:hypothetical protein